MASDEKNVASCMSDSEFVCPSTAYASYRADEKVLIAIGPYRLEGPVVEGFKRGSKLLGFPTANLAPSAFENVFIKDNHEVVGVYAGWVSINDGEVYKTVLSVGYNPYFKNKDKTVETYIVHHFEKDFYGSNMKLLICGYLRPQYDYPTMDSLIQAIQDDVKVGTAALDTPQFARFKTDPFFVGNNHDSSNHLSHSNPTSSSSSSSSSSSASSSSSSNSISNSGSSASPSSL